jgi:hypothetical protein
MAMSNHERVGRGLEALRAGLIPFALRELKARYKARWWADGVEASLTGAAGIEARRTGGTDEERFAALDVQALLVLLWNQWNEVFQQKLGHAGRTYVSELREVRNRWAHQQAFSADDAHRALDTMTRLLQMVSADEAQETARLARELLRLRFEEESKRELRRSAQVAETGAPYGLKAWREVATPHPDVASGRYRQAEFAADLAAVISGEADPEYQDPVEFFRRTYLTEGLTRLLVLTLERLSGVGGEPVVELQTNFGGGKTHSLLALYHLFGGAVAPGQVPGLEKVLEQAHVTALPKARRAVLVGSKFNPAAPHRMSDGTEVRTFWGELAWWLGDKKGYKLVAEADQKGVSPGSDTLKALFDQFGPALVLIDEWVAFLRNLHGVDRLPAGSFEANLSFAQALTEAANRTRNALVVVSIPASDIEKGGPAGELALDSLRKFIGRMEAAWKPATAEESFEIVRRRLFQPIRDFAARDAVSQAFIGLYRESKGEFPVACIEADYERRLKAAYPVHPELFDRLYQDWSTLEQFQRTRGVLRLMAAVIHELWERQDRSLVIMPGTVPLDSTPVRTELTRYLPEGWAAVIDTDVDGPESRPLALDRQVPNLGRYSACRRVTRTVFLGSAPSVAAERVRGLEEVRIKLGCVQPGEASAAFGDALRRLTEHLVYLYSDGSRYWFDTHRNVNREAEDRAAQYRIEAVEDKIVERLRRIRERADFGGVHMCPDSADVPDEQTARLVVLGPRFVHSPRLETSPAVEEARKILDQRGSSSRIYRNMLVFVAPDRERAPELDRAVRQWMAWTSILDDEEKLNLDAFQRRQAHTAAERADDTVEARLKETFSWLLVPGQEGTDPVRWEASRLSGGDESLVVRAAKKLKANQQLITQWSPALLKMELARWLWQDHAHVGVKKVWECLCTYLYLPRLRDEDVLTTAIRDGVRSREHFGYALSVTPDGRYQGLQFGQAGGTIYLDAAAVLVKPEIAAKQLEADAEVEGKSPVSYPPAERTAAGKPSKETEAEFQVRPLPRRFHGSVTLDPTRLGRDAGRIAEEVVQHLAGLVGSKVEVTLEIHVEIPEGVPDHVVRTVTENCCTLKFKSQGFEEV